MRWRRSSDLVGANMQFNIEGDGRHRLREDNILFVYHFKNTVILVTQNTSNMSRNKTLNRFVVSGLYRVCHSTSNVMKEFSRGTCKHCSAKINIVCI